MQNRMSSIEYSTSLTLDGWPLEVISVMEFF